MSRITKLGTIERQLIRRAVSRLFASVRTPAYRRRIMREGFAQIREMAPTTGLLPAVYSVKDAADVA